MWKWVGLLSGALLFLIIFFFYDIVLDKCADVQGPYVFLRSAHVKGRRGPSKDYPCIYEYRRRFLPMAIIEQQGEWFLLKDWQGLQSWVHRSLCSKRRRYVMTVTENAPLYVRKSTSAPKLAMIQKNVCLEFVRSQESWLRVSVSSTSGYVCKGWMRRENVWGAL